MVTYAVVTFILRATSMTGTQYAKRRVLSIYTIINFSVEATAQQSADV